ncbi:Gfo/Idh/MocA family oxidoreductase [Geodermatophilus sabuli]|uniref:Gfo/Idh/MocA family oxidoreductase n=1 Tax=Geodermatophilus sabuli TaxID=1564158 RepID=A0A7K3W0R4_9ACTN|nr:Gfo/Idh/MocA family oxidoreductase [Geodermatophilus sabuli]
MTGGPRLRIGVVGASYAAGTHLPAYAALPEVEVVAVATAHAETAEAVARRFGVPRAHVGFERLCADPEVDLVDVATRPSRHRGMAEAALAAGKHVLCEAPLAASVADGAAMAAAAQRAGRLGLVDMQSRFWPGLAEFRRLVDEGFLGTLENVEVRAFYPTFTRPERVPSSLWCADAGSGASSLRIHGLHSVDLVQWLFGELSGVQGTAATRRPVWPTPEGELAATSRDSVAFTGRLPGGAVVSVHTSWVAWHGSGWRLAAYGSAGALVATAAGHTGHFPVRLAGARAEDAELVEIRPRPGPGDDLPELAPDAATLPFARLVRRLAGVLLDGGDPAAAAARAQLPTFADGLRLLELADAVDGGQPSGPPSG